MLRAGVETGMEKAELIAVVAGILLALCSCDRAHQETLAAVPIPGPSRSLPREEAGRVAPDPYNLKSEENLRSQTEDGNRLGLWPRSTVYDRPGADRSGWEQDPNLMPPVRSPTSPGNNPSSPGNPRGTGGRPIAP